MKTELFIEKAKTIHGDRYDYCLVKYIHSNTKVSIKCPVHGIFEQSPNTHLNGRGCRLCGIESMKAKRNNKFTTEYFVKRATKKFNGFYKYDKTIYKSNKDSVCITCPIHGDFLQTPDSHLVGKGCSKCGVIKSHEFNKDLFTNEIFIKKAKEVHGNYYNYSNIRYTTANTPINIVCPLHGKFAQSPNNHLAGCGCSKCFYRGWSKQEDEVYNFISRLKNVEKSNRTILQGKEIDMYIPDKKIAIEYDGIYWHSSAYIDKEYHLKKTELCKEQGIQLIHIFSDEWIYKQEIVKSRLRQLLGIQSGRTFARKCEIKEVPTKDAMQFQEQNHIQGAVGSQVKLGLYYNNELQALMTFNKPRINLGRKKESIEEGEYELLRYCTKLNSTVVGGASKLLKHFETQYKPTKIISYADRRWSEGNLYYKLGFKLDSITKPNYFYVVGQKRENRFKYRKSELVKQGHDSKLTESEITQSLGLQRVYDCGTLKFLKLFGN